jgi:hypothetical protein
LIPAGEEITALPRNELLLHQIEANAATVARASGGRWAKLPSNAAPQ